MEKQGFQALMTQFDLQTLSVIITKQITVASLVITAFKIINLLNAGTSCLEIKGCLDILLSKQIKSR